MVSLVYTLFQNFVCGYWFVDHNDWAQWTGDKWNLDFSIFTPGVQTESFNQTLGTPENPSCLSSGGVCAAGDPAAPGFGPQVVCCEGLACKRDEVQAGIYYCM